MRKHPIGSPVGQWGTFQGEMRMTSKSARGVVLDTIRRIPPFTALRDAEWQRLVPEIAIRSFPEGVFLFFEGDPPRALYVLLEGHVALIRHTAEGRDVVLDIMRPGSMIGELAVLEGMPYSASAKTLTEVRAVVFTRDQFMRLLQTYPQMATAVIYDLVRRVRHLSDLVQSLAIERVEQRLARILLRLMKISGEPHERGTLITLPLTRQDLADMAGTTVETTIRTLSRMRREGIVDTMRGRILILDSARLTHLAEEGR